MLGKLKVMKKSKYINKGFTLIELLVVVAIMGIIAVSVVIGFNSFGNTIRVRETAGVLTDTIKKLELETIRRDYKKNTVHFETDYLVVESEVEGQTGKENFSLEWIKDGNCAADEELKINNTSSSTVYLAQRDQYGNNMEISSFPSNESKCINFSTSDEIEWQFQLFQGSELSKVIRFIHFNVRRGITIDPVTITSGNGYILEISAPYAKKVFPGREDKTVKLTLESIDADIDPVIIILQE